MQFVQREILYTPTDVLAEGFTIYLRCIEGYGWRLAFSGGRDANIVW